jgi:hypothetical protein
MNSPAARSVDLLAVSSRAWERADYKWDSKQYQKQVERELRDLGCSDHDSSETQHRGKDCDNEKD